MSVLNFCTRKNINKASVQQCITAITADSTMLRLRSAQARIHSELRASVLNRKTVI